MNPNLSVIVPVYKVEPYLRQCLDSIVNQTYQDMEIIVIDDGSPDNCGAICDEYAAKYPQMRVIHQENAGVQAARNHGIDEAHGKWVAFVDSDDWVDMDYYESMFRALGNRKVDIFCANGHIRDYEHKSLLQYYAHQNFEYHDREHLDILMVRIEAPRAGESQGKDFPRASVYIWDKLYRMEFLQNYGFRFYENRKIFWEDNPFNYSAFYKAESVAGSNICGYHYRQHSASVMHKYNPDMLNVCYELISTLRKAVPQKLENPIFRDAIYTMSITMIIHILEFCYLHPSNPDSRFIVKRRIREMTRMPYFYNALYQCPNKYLSKKQIVWKYLLRQPFLWPLELVMKGNAWREQILGKVAYE